MEERGTRARHADEAAGRRLRAGQAPATTTPSSPPTPARSPPGPRGTSTMRRGQMCSPARATWPPWPAACPTPSRRRSPIPTGRCVAFVGDGGFTMLMGEFATCVKYKLPVKIVIIKNNTLGQIKWEQMVFLGNPEYGVRPAADRLRRLRARPAAARLHHRGPERLRRDRWIRRWPTPGPA